MSLFLLALLSFLMGILTMTALPFFQNRQAKRWKKTLVNDLIKDNNRLFEEREQALQRQKELLEKKEAKLKLSEKELVDLEKKRKELLGGETEEVKKRLLRSLEEKVRKENQDYLGRIRSESQHEAKKIILNALHRLSLPDLISSSREKIILKEEPLKGRIVGPEGKNIRFLEEKLHVKLLLDLEPSTLIISSWDPEKREFAKRVIAALLVDGKIFPKRIEEVIERIKEGWDGEITKIGECAFKELSLSFPHRRISHVLGKLAFRYSFGQNLIDHSKEVGLILGSMAVELGLSEALGRRIGLLHDIGKALVSEDKSHALAGMEFLSTHGESLEVSNGVGCHHFEVEPLTELGSLCHLADALSAGKEGARRESLSIAIRQKNLKGQTSFSK